MHDTKRDLYQHYVWEISKIRDNNSRPLLFLFLALCFRMCLRVHIRKNQ